MDDIDQAISDLNYGTPGQAQAVGAANDNPDHAAEAVRLSSATGAPAQAIYNDLPGFKAAARESTASGLVAGNPQLGRFVSDPMAARVSNDDLDTLDAMSAPLNKVASRSWWQRLGDVRSEHGPIDAALEGFTEGADTTQDDAELAKAGSGSGYGAAVVRGAEPWLRAFNMAVRFPGAVANAAIEGANQFNKDLTGDQTDTLKNELNTLMIGEMGRGHVGEAAVAAKPFLDEGRAPPPGVHPEIDAVHASQNAADLAALNEALGQAAQSMTRQRSPEMFGEYVKQHTGDRTVGISHDAARSLYGTDVPTPGDGKLGFVPDLPAQLLRSTITGEDIQVPVSDYLTHIDPAVHEELSPYIRTRPEGITAAEGIAAAVSQVDTPVDALRASTGLERPFNNPYTTSFPVGDSAPYLGGLLRRDTGDLLHYGNTEGENYQAHYSNVGKAENLSDVIEGLGHFSDGDPLQDASAEVMNHVFKELGVDKTPTYTVAPDNPAGGHNYGTYYPSADAITLRHMGDPMMSRRIAVHEGAHAAFLHQLEASPDIKGLVSWLVDVGRSIDTAPPADEAAFNIPDGAGGERLSRHYGLTNEHEFLSEAFSNPQFQEYLSSISLTPEEAAEFNRRVPGGSVVKTLWDALLHVARKAFGLPLNDGAMTALDAAFRVGDELTARGRGTGEAGGSLASADPLANRAGAIGMTRAQLDRYRELILKQREEDAQARNAKILSEERRRQSDEWKDNRAGVRQEMIDRVAERRDVVGDVAFNNGTRLDTDFLTERQREQLDGLHTRGGTDPESFAKTLGFDNVDQMADEVRALRDDRGDKRPVDYRRELISRETDAEMGRRYGNLDKNVVEAAKDRVLNDTQMEILQAEAEAAGSPVTKATMSSNVRDLVADMPMSAVSSDAAMTAAGRAARGIEDALLKGDAKEAFAQRMRQFNHLLAAKRMVEVEKAKARFDKIVKRYTAREVPGASQEYVDQIHNIMVNRLGLGVKRSLDDINQSVANSGYDNLQGFVKAKTESFRDLFVPDFLQADGFSTTVDKLTVAQFEEVHKAFEAMTFNARDELKVTRAGEKADLRETISEMRTELAKRGPAKAYDASPDKRSLGSVISHAWWSMINLEKMLHRLDGGDRAGVFTQTITRAFTEAANYKERVLKEFNDKLNQFGRIDGYEAEVKNDLFIDPATGQPMPMKRKNVLGILQNVGNEENLKKLAAGWKLDPAQVMDWVWKNTTKEDWDRAQGIGDLFNELHDRADTMSRNVSGVGIDKIEMKDIDTPFGTYKGWYNPIKYDEYRLGKSKSLLGAGALEAEGYYRATTPKGYTKSRTGYIAPVELSLDIVPSRMHQMIHDITMRPAVLQLGKFFYDPEFRQGIISHYGKTQETQLEPFLRDMANAPNFSSVSASVANGFLRELSSNMVSTLVGLNPRTVAKHSSTAAIKSAVEGGPAFFRELFTLTSKDDLGQSNWSMAMEKSDELARRMRNWSELIEGKGQNVSLHSSATGSRFKDWKSTAVYLGSLPIALTDLMSAVPTWLVTYKDAIARGEDEGMAKFLADTSVRDTHGSSIETNKPQITRTRDPIKKSFATLYGFFSENLQKQYEMSWRAREAFAGAKEGDWEKFREQIPKIATLAFTSVIVPAIIEEIVSGEGDPREGWGHRAGRVLIHGMTSSMIGVRELTGSLMSNHDAGGGLLGTIGKTVTDSGRDARDFLEGKRFTTDRKARAIRHAFTLTGMATGLTNAQEGRSLEYAYRYFHGAEHPHDPWQAAMGLAKGTSKVNR